MNTLPAPLKLKLVHEPGSDYIHATAVTMFALMCATLYSFVCTGRPKRTFSVCKNHMEFIIVSMGCIACDLVKKTMKFQTMCNFFKDDMGWAYITPLYTVSSKSKPKGCCPLLLMHVCTPSCEGMSSVREYVFYVFFQISKNMTFYVFFEMTYQKVVKSL